MGARVMDEEEKEGGGYLGFVWEMGKRGKKDVKYIGLYILGLGLRA